MSYLIYLRKVDYYPDNPYIKWMPDGREIKRIYFTIIKIWELKSSDIREIGLESLLPLIMLTKDGANLTTYDQLTEELEAKGQGELLTLTIMFASLSLKGQSSQEGLRRRVAMSRDKELFKDSWFVQELLKEGEEKGEKKGVEKGIIQASRRMFFRSAGGRSLISARRPTA